MKEAAGEANMTVVTIILITAIVAVVTPIITSTMKSTASRTCCQNMGYVWKDNNCYNGNQKVNKSAYVNNDGSCKDV